MESLEIRKPFACRILSLERFGSDMWTVLISMLQGGLNNTVLFIGSYSNVDLEFDVCHISVYRHSPVSAV